MYKAPGFTTKAAKAKKLLFTQLSAPREISGCRKCTVAAGYTSDWANWTLRQHPQPLSSPHQ